MRIRALPPCRRRRLAFDHAAALGNVSRPGVDGYCELQRVHDAVGGDDDLPLRTIDIFVAAEIVLDLLPERIIIAQEIHDEFVQPVIENRFDAGLAEARHHLVGQLVTGVALTVVLLEVSQVIDDFGETE